MREFGFNEGLEEAIMRIGLIRNRPRLVTVYGLLDSGKSYLIDKIGDYFERKGIEAGRYSGAPMKSIFETLRDRPRAIKEMLLFHYGCERCIYDEKDPNNLARSVLNRDIDLNILIFKSHYRSFSLEEANSRVDGEYDIIISNPDSKIKP